MPIEDFISPDFLKDESLSEVSIPGAENAPRDPFAEEPASATSAIPEEQEKTGIEKFIGPEFYTPEPPAADFSLGRMVKNIPRDIGVGLGSAARGLEMIAAGGGYHPTKKEGEETPVYQDAFWGVVENAVNPVLFNKGAQSFYKMIGDILPERPKETENVSRFERQVSSTLENLPEIGVSLVPWAGVPMATILATGRMVQGEYDNYISQGADPTAAREAAIVAGLHQMGPELLSDLVIRAVFKSSLTALRAAKALPKAGAALTGTAAEIEEKTLAKAGLNLTAAGIAKNTFKRLVPGALTEGAEEIPGELISTAGEIKARDPSLSWTDAYARAWASRGEIWKQAVDQAVDGFVSGGLLGIPAAALGVIADVKTRRVAKRHGYYDANKGGVATDAVGTPGATISGMDAAGILERAQAELPAAQAQAAQDEAAQKAELNSRLLQQMESLFPPQTQGVGDLRPPGPLRTPGERANWIRKQELASPEGRQSTIDETGMEDTLPPEIAQPAAPEPQVAPPARPAPLVPMQEQKDQNPLWEFGATPVTEAPPKPKAPRKRRKKVSEIPTQVGLFEGSDIQSHLQDTNEPIFEKFGERPASPWDEDFRFVRPGDFENNQGPDKTPALHNRIVALDGELRAQELRDRDRVASANTQNGRQTAMDLIENKRNEQAAAIEKMKSEPAGQSEATDMVQVMRKIAQKYDLKIAGQSSKGTKFSYKGLSDVVDSVQDVTAEEDMPNVRQALVVVYRVSQAVRNGGLVSKADLNALARSQKKLAPSAKELPQVRAVLHPAGVLISKLYGRGDAPETMVPGKGGLFEILPDEYKKGDFLDVKAALQKSSGLIEVPWGKPLSLEVLKKIHEEGRRSNIPAMANLSAMAIVAPYGAQSGSTAYRTAMENIGNTNEVDSFFRRAGLDIQPERGRVSESERAAAPKSEVLDYAADIAAQQPNTEPTPGQAAAGNYKKAHITVHGMPVAIENPAGSTRTDKKHGNNPHWSQKMADHYGYIELGERTQEGDRIDVFILNGPAEKSKKVFILDQMEGGKFDEPKVIIGANTKEEALKIYRRNNPGGNVSATVTEFSVDEFKSWLSHGNFKIPAAGQTPVTLQQWIDHPELRVGYWQQPYNKTFSDDEAIKFSQRTVNEIIESEYQKYLAKNGYPVTNPVDLLDKRPGTLIAYEAIMREATRDKKGEYVFAVGDFIHVPPQTNEQLAAVALAKKLFGKTLVYFTAPFKGHKIEHIAGGFIRSLDEMLINSKTENPVMFVLGHEISHRMQKTDPDLWKRAVAVFDHFKDPETFRKQFEIRNNIRAELNQGPMSVEHFLEEHFSDYSGLMFMDKKFWERVAENGFLPELAAFIKKVFAILIRNGKTSEGGLRYIASNKEIVDRAISDAYREHFSRETKKAESAQVQIESSRNTIDTFASSLQDKDKKKLKAIEVDPHDFKKIRKLGIRMGGVEGLRQYLNGHGVPKAAVARIVSVFKTDQKYPLPKVSETVKRILEQHKRDPEKTHWYEGIKLISKLLERSGATPERVRMMMEWAIVGFSSKNAGPQQNVENMIVIYKSLWMTTPVNMRPRMLMTDKELRRLFTGLSMDDFFHVSKDKFGLETGALKMRNYANTFISIMENDNVARMAVKSVIDLWMIRYFFPHLAVKTIGKDKTSVSLTPIQQEQVQQHMRAVENELRKKTGETWFPDQAQAALWFWIRNDWIERGVVKHGTEDVTLDQALMKRLIMYSGRDQISDDVAWGIALQYLRDPGTRVVLDHYGRGAWGILDPNFQGTGVPGKEWSSDPDHVRPRRIHLYEAGVVPEKQFEGMHKMRAVIDSTRIYPISQDPKGYKHKYGLNHMGDLDAYALAEMEKELIRDGWIGMSSGDTTVVFHPTVATELVPYAVSFSPMSSVGMVDKARKNGWGNIASRVDRVLALEEMKDYERISALVQTDILRVMNHPLVDISRIYIGDGRYQGGNEFAIPFEVESSNKDVLKGLVAKLLKTYMQFEGIISRPLSPFNGKLMDESRVDKEQAPSRVFEFEKPVSESDLKKISEILQSHGIGGSTYIPHLNSLVAHHILERDATSKKKKYKIDRKGFNGAMAMSAAEFSTQLSQKPVDVGHIWFEHEVIRNDWGQKPDGETYDKLIYAGDKATRDLGIIQEIPVGSEAKGAGRQMGPLYQKQASLYSNKAAGPKLVPASPVSGLKDLRKRTSEMAPYEREQFDRWLAQYGPDYLDDQFIIDSSLQSTDVAHQASGADEPPMWASRLRDEISKNFPKKGTPKIYSEMIKRWMDRGKVNKEEVEWSMVQQWLDSLPPGQDIYRDYIVDQPKEKRAGTLLGYLEDHSAEISEIIYGEEINLTGWFGFDNYEELKERIRSYTIDLKGHMNGMRKNLMVIGHKIVRKLKDQGYIESDWDPSNTIEMYGVHADLMKHISLARIEKIKENGGKVLEEILDGDIETAIYYISDHLMHPEKTRRMLDHIESIGYTPDAHRTIGGQPTPEIWEAYSHAHELMTLAEHADLYASGFGGIENTTFNYEYAGPNDELVRHRKREMGETTTIDTVYDRYTSSLPGAYRELIFRFPVKDLKLPEGYTIVDAEKDDVLRKKYSVPGGGYSWAVMKDGNPIDWVNSADSGIMAAFLHAGAPVNSPYIHGHWKKEVNVFGHARYKLTNIDDVIGTVDAKEIPGMPPGDSRAGKVEVTLRDMIPALERLPQDTIILVAEEAQSDWHTQGRARGYSSNKFALPPSIESLRNHKPKGSGWGAFIPEHLLNLRYTDLLVRYKRAMTQSGDEKRAIKEGARGQIYQREKELRGRASILLKFAEQIGDKDLVEMLFPYVSQWGDDKIGVVQDAPFKKVWPNIIMRRLVRIAAAKGAAGIMWFDGKIQNDRYNVGNYFESISITIPSEASGHSSVTITAKGERNLDEQKELDYLPDYIPEDLLKKIMQQQMWTGELMTVSEYVNKVGKKEAYKYKNVRRIHKRVVKELNDYRKVIDLWFDAREQQAIKFDYKAENIPDSEAHNININMRRQVIERLDHQQRTLYDMLALKKESLNVLKPFMKLSTYKEEGVREAIEYAKNELIDLYKKNAVGLQENYIEYFSSTGDIGGDFIPPEIVRGRKSSPLPPSGQYSKKYSISLTPEQGGEDKHSPLYNIILKNAFEKNFGNKEWGENKLTRFENLPVKSTGGRSHYEGAVGKGRYNGVISLFSPKVKEKVLRKEPDFMWSLQSVPEEVSTIIDGKIGAKKVPMGEKLKAATSDFYKNWRTRVLDRLDPIKRYFGELSNAYVFARGIPGIESTLGAMMEHGKLFINGENAITTSTIKQGFVPWLKKLGPDGNKFFYWLIVRRSEQLAAQGREKLFTDEDRQVLLNWIGTPTTQPNWEAINTEFQEWNNSVLDLAEKAGIIDPEKRKVWQSDVYIPFYRVLETDEALDEYTKGPVRGGKFLSNQIKRLKGSEAKIGDPMENIVRNWAHLVGESMRNRARAEAYNAGLAMNSQTGMATLDPDNPGTVPLPLIEEVQWKDTVVFKSAGKGSTFVHTKTGEPILNVLINGENKFFRVNDPELFAALAQIDPNQFNHWFWRFASGSKALLTKGATFGPAFRIANMVRDTMHTFMISDSFVPFWDTARGLVKALAQNKDFVEFMAAGHSFAGSYTKADNPQMMGRYLKRLVDKEGMTVMDYILWSPKKVLEFWQKIGEASENAARVQLYANLRKKGETMNVAAFKARDLLDFNMRGGSGFVRAITTLVPFTNARMEGLYKMGRAVAEAPGQVLLKGAILSAASIGLWLAYADDDRYKQLEDWERWTYYHFWIGDKHFRIPKPFESGVLTSSIWEATGNVLKGNEELSHFWKFLGTTLMDTFAFNPIPQLVKPIAEQVFNYNSFTGRPIEGQRLQNLPPGMRAEAWSSPTLKAFGEATNLSPKRAEALINGYLSSFGMLGLTVSDAITRAFSDLPEPPTTPIGQLPVVGRFLKGGKEVSNTKHMVRFYEISQDANQLAGAVKTLVAAGRAEEAKEMIEKNPILFGIHKTINSIEKKMSTINSQMRMIYLDRKMTAEEKRDKLDELVQIRLYLSKTFMDLYNKETRK